MVNQLVMVTANVILQKGLVFVILALKERNVKVSLIKIFSALVYPLSKSNFR